MEATNDQLRDLLLYLDKVHSFLSNTDAKDIIHAKDLDRINNDWRNFTVKLMKPDKEKHPTEQKYPEQCKRFRELLDEMYKVHLKKNADYSPYNILVTGMKGLVTRMWDKSARFFNLMGLDIGTYEWKDEKMNEVEDEDVNQTLIDWANYAVITRIFREGKWGK